MTVAAQGIGKAIARIFSENGAVVVLCDMLKDKLIGAADKIHNATGIETMALKVDITRLGNIEETTKKVLDPYGRTYIL